MTTTIEADRTDWVLCPACRNMAYGKRLSAALMVCPDCAHHNRLTAPQRLTTLLDPGSCEVLDLPVETRDVLGFTDSVGYPERLRRARAATGLHEAAIVARGTITGIPVMVAAMDFRFLGGSLGAGVGELVVRAARTALADRCALVLVPASGGARMQEGVISLMQMARTCQALQELDEAGLLTISLVTDPTYGGVAASFASACDIIVAEPGARFGFAGPRVIEQTIRQQLPEGFQTAEFLLEHGLIDLVCERGGLRTILGRLLVAGTTASTVDGGFSSTVDAVDTVVVAPGTLPVIDPWEAVQRARDIDRPTTLDYARRLLDGFTELRGDRLSADCPAVVGGIGRLDGRPVVLIGHQKGHTAAELATRNFGMASPAGHRKAARLMRLAAKLSMPVVTLVDTPGAYPGAEAEEQGQAVAVAENLKLMAGLPVPIVCTVIGEGGSGGALGLAVADRVLICQRGTYSVISPEGCAAILWKDPAAAPQAARALKVDAMSLLQLEVVDGIVPEPDGPVDLDRSAARLRAAITEQLDELSALSAGELIIRRRNRFDRFAVKSNDES